MASHYMVDWYGYGDGFYHTFQRKYIEQRTVEGPLIVPTRSQGASKSHFGFYRGGYGLPEEVQFQFGD